MRSFMGLLKRNILVYLKDRQSVFFSILSPIIILALYLFFLRGTFVDGLESAMKDAVDIIGHDDISSFANLIVVAGVLGSALMTVSYASLSTIVADKQNKVSYDILSTPVSRAKIILAYLLAAVVSPFLITAAILTAALIIVTLMGNTYLTALNIVKLYGILALGTLSATSFMMMIVMFFKTTSASGAFTGILCAASGFVIGAYIPISQFSNTIQTICNIFPASHITCLFRNELLGGVLANMDKTLNGIDNHVMIETVTKEFSLNLNMFGNLVKTEYNYILVSAILVVTTIIVSLVYNKTYKAK